MRGATPSRGRWFEPVAARCKEREEDGRGDWIRCEDAVAAILGGTLTDDEIAQAAKLATRAAKPLDNTDHVSRWRKKVVEVEVRRALTSLRA